MRKLIVILTTLLTFPTAILAQDWPSRNGSRNHNAVVDVNKELVEFEIGSGGKSANIKWSVETGMSLDSEPAIANGLVWIGGSSYRRDELTRNEDAGVLFCFRESDGKLLYQHVSQRREEGRNYDWPVTGITSTPYIEDDRLYFCTNRCEIICLDIGALIHGMGEVSGVWKVDMIEKFGVIPGVAHIACRHLHCSPVVWGDYVYVNPTHSPRPDVKDDVSSEKEPVPSLICFNRHSGEVKWTDRTPGKSIVGQQWNNPTVIHAGGRDQVIMGQGDGWVRSFDCVTGKLIWEFDINNKSERLEFGNGWGWMRSLRQVVAEPVFHNDRLYLVAGTEHESCEATGRLCCIDPSKTGDLSIELLTADKEIIDNPNSALIWEFKGSETGLKGFEADAKSPNVMHISYGSVAVHDGLVIAVDLNGSVHCLDEKTGKRYWTYNVDSRFWCSPLILGKAVIVGSEEGYIYSIPVRKQLDEKEIRIDKTLLVQHASAIFANDTIYLSTNGKLFSIPCRDIE
jgi:outer membrane protein assembly factor BamB